MAVSSLVDEPLSSESMKFPVFSLLTGNFETETSSLVTAPSSSESDANLTSFHMQPARILEGDGFELSVPSGSVVRTRLPIS